MFILILKTLVLFVFLTMKSSIISINVRYILKNMTINATYTENSIHLPTNTKLFDDLLMSANNNELINIEMDWLNEIFQETANIPDVDIDSDYGNAQKTRRIPTSGERNNGESIKQECEKINNILLSPINHNKNVYYCKFDSLNRIINRIFMRFTLKRIIKDCDKHFTTTENPIKMTKITRYIFESTKFTIDYFFSFIEKNIKNIINDLILLYLIISDFDDKKMKVYAFNEELNKKFNLVASEEIKFDSSVLIEIENRIIGEFKKSYAQNIQVQNQIFSFFTQTLAVINESEKIIPIAQLLRRVASGMLKTRFQVPLTDFTKKNSTSVFKAVILRLCKLLRSEGRGKIINKCMRLYIQNYDSYVKHYDPSIPNKIYNIYNLIEFKRFISDMFFQSIKKQNMKQITNIFRKDINMNATIKRVRAILN